MPHVLSKPPKIVSVWIGLVRVFTLEPIVVVELADWLLLGHVRGWSQPPWEYSNGGGCRFYLVSPQPRGHQLGTPRPFLADPDEDAWPQL